MALRVDDETDSKNPGVTDYDKKFNDIKKAEEDAAFDDIKDNFNKTADGSSEDSNIKKLQDSESQGSDGGWANNVSKLPIKSGGKFKKKNLLIGGGVGGILALIPIMMFSLMPLKLESFIQNIYSSASAIPGYAVEQRTEYLITRALATRLLMAANGGASINGIEGRLVFCSNGSIACSLFATYTNEYFEKKLGITIDVEANGRARLGGKAASWNVTAAQSVGDPYTPLRQVTTQISTNKEMKSIIRQEVHSKTKGSQILTRYLARKSLMKKYGVTRWRPFEKTTNRAVDLKTSFNAYIASKTVGKISPKLALYMTCLSGETQTCLKLRERSVASIPNPDDNPNYSDPDKLSTEDRAKYDAEKAKYETRKEALGRIGSSSPSDGDIGKDGVMNKLITKQVLSKVGGGVAIAGVLDLVFGVIGGIENGSIEKIWVDMFNEVHLGFSTEAILINDAMKAGDVDTETLSLMYELFNDAEKSALYQSETGILPTATGLGYIASASSGFAAQCQVDAEIKEVALDPGELICPEEKANKNYSSIFTDFPGWDALYNVANVWNNSVGVIFDGIGEGVGWLLEVTGIQGAMSALMNTLGLSLDPLIEWLVGLIFEPPHVGADAAGSNNYNSLSAGIRVQQNALMEEGVDTNGTAMGGGGRLLTNQEVAAIYQESKESEQDLFNSQSNFAKIFDINLQGSFMQRFISSIPTSTTSLASLAVNSPINILASLAFGNAHAATNSTATANPFGLPIYGYTASDPVFTADPSIYTEESCAISAQEREDSIITNHDEYRGYTIYEKSDPCALEKMVVGSALVSEGVMDDKYSLKLPGSASSTTGEIVSPTDEGAYVTSGFGPRNCSGCSPWHAAIDLVLPNGTAHKPVYAIGDGEVIMSGIGGPGGNGVLCSGMGSGEPNNTIKIRLSNGVEVEYLHTGGKDITVNVGDQVTAGQVIGKINNCGQSNGAHLHIVIDVGETTDEAILSLPRSPASVRGGKGVNPIDFFELYGIRFG